MPKHSTNLLLSVLVAVSSLVHIITTLTYVSRRCHRPGHRQAHRSERLAATGGRFSQFCRSGGHVDLFRHLLARVSSVCHRSRRGRHQNRAVSGHLHWRGYVHRVADCVRKAPRCLMYTWAWKLELDANLSLGILNSASLLLPGRHLINSGMLMANVGAMAYYMMTNNLMTGLGMLGLTAGLSSAMGVTLTVAIGGVYRANA